MNSGNTQVWEYPLSDIDFDEAETSAVLEVLHSKWLSLGPRTKEFERSFARYADVPFALATANCTAALHMALISLGIGQGDEVIVPSLTFVATSNAVLYAGARPVFADVASLDSPLMDPADVERKISRQTRAIIVMHYGGYPCDMERMKVLAEKHGLFVIEDAAHAVGSLYAGKMCGTIGDVGCYSFFANKNLPVGEGGMLVTENKEIYERLTKLRSHGLTSQTWERSKGAASAYDVVELGYNYRPTEISAAIGLVQLQKLSENNRKRNVLFEEYLKALPRSGFLDVPFSGLTEKGVYARHLFPIVLDEGMDREKFMARMKHHGVQTSIHYPPVHLLSYYRSLLDERQAQGLDHTEAYGRRAVSLPMHPLLTAADVGKICHRVGLALQQDDRWRTEES